jgi:hypothetical protein
VQQVSIRTILVLLLINFDYNQNKGLFGSLGYAGITSAGVSPRDTILVKSSITF